MDGPLSKLVYVPDYQNVFIKNSQSENPKMTILTDLSSKLNSEPSKQKKNVTKWKIEAF